MNISRPVAIAVTVLASGLSGTAVAASAHADPALLNGSFSGVAGDPMSVWTIATNCGPAGCAGTVASNKGWTTPTAPTGGRWTFNVTTPESIVCADGRAERVVIGVSVDPVTLDGVMTTDSNAGCPGGTVSHTPFQLARVG